LVFPALPSEPTALPASRLALLLLLLAACASGRPAREAGERPLSPFYDRKVSDREGDTSRTVQVRPFYWSREDERGKRVNVLGPLVRYRADDAYERLQVFPNVFYSARHEPGNDKRWWFLFFPFLFLGHDDFLVLPFGGYSHGLLGFSQLLMVTPLYIRTRQTSAHPTDPTTYTVHSVLFPFLSWGSDGREGGRRKLKIAPFYGKSIERDGGTSGFVMWPFYSWRKTGGEEAFFVFPFYGRSSRATSRETTILFPFYVRRENFLTGSRDVSLWPFWRKAGGSEDLEARRLWPFAGWQRVDHTTEEFVAWPFWRRMYRDDPLQFARYVWVPPFYRHVKLYDRADGRLREKRSLWPLFRKETSSDGAREVSVPHLLPIDAPAIQEMIEPVRPFASLYHRRTGKGGDRETSALFGAYLSRVEGERRKVRILGGLLGWDRGPGGRVLRLLWAIRIPFGKGASP